MILIEPKDYFDLNKIGLPISIPIVITLLVLNVEVLIKFSAFVFVLIFDLWLWFQINKYRGVKVLLRSSGDWQIQRQDEILNVKLKEYWKLKGFVCLWLTAKEESLSILISRRIIGAENFSKIYIQLK